MIEVVLKIVEGKETLFLVDDVTKKILDEKKYLGTIGDSIVQLMELEEGKEIIVSDKNNKDILRVQLQEEKTILAIEKI
ncbi:hypothetical protein [Cetobacterium sp.]|uniref:hypothetical protein n=1 Tax=Cetobacterium sp. TaxID=2071632 RepID=UPI003EE5CC64